MSYKAVPSKAVGDPYDAIVVRDEVVVSTQAPFCVQSIPNLNISNKNNLNRRKGALSAAEGIIEGNNATAKPSKDAASSILPEILGEDASPEVPPALILVSILAGGGGGGAAGGGGARNRSAKPPNRRPASGTSRPPIIKQRPNSAALVGIRTALPVLDLITDDIEDALPSSRAVKDVTITATPRALVNLKPLISTPSNTSADILSGVLPIVAKPAAITQKRPPSSNRSRPQSKAGGNAASSDPAAVAEDPATAAELKAHPRLVLPAPSKLDISIRLPSNDIDLFSPTNTQTVAGLHDLSPEHHNATTHRGFGASSHPSRSGPTRQSTDFTLMSGDNVRGAQSSQEALDSLGSITNKSKNADVVNYFANKLQLARLSSVQHDANDSSEGVDMVVDGQYLDEYLHMVHRADRPGEEELEVADGRRMDNYVNALTITKYIEQSDHNKSNIPSAFDTDKVIVVRSPAVHINPMWRLAEGATDNQSSHVHHFSNNRVSPNQSATSSPRDFYPNAPVPSARPPPNPIPNPNTNSDSIMRKDNVELSVADTAAYENDNGDDDGDDDDHNNGKVNLVAHDSSCGDGDNQGGEEIKKDDNNDNNVDDTVELPATIEATPLATATTAITKQIPSEYNHHAKGPHRDLLGSAFWEMAFDPNAQATLPTTAAGGTHHDPYTPFEVDYVGVNTMGGGFKPASIGYTKGSPQKRAQSAHRMIGRWRHDSHSSSNNNNSNISELVVTPARPTSAMPVTSVSEAAGALLAAFSPSLTDEYSLSAVDEGPSQQIQQMYQPRGLLWGDNKVYNEASVFSGQTANRGLGTATGTGTANMTDSSFIATARNDSYQNPVVRSVLRQLSLNTVEYLEATQEAVDQSPPSPPNQHHNNKAQSNVHRPLSGSPQNRNKYKHYKNRSRHDSPRAVPFDPRDYEIHPTEDPPLHSIAGDGSNELPLFQLDDSTRNQIQQQIRTFKGIKEWKTKGVNNIISAKINAKLSR